MTRAVVFDVNETLLEMGALDPWFMIWFGDRASRKAWFALTLHFAMTLAATRAYRGFGDVGVAALRGSRNHGTSPCLSTPLSYCARKSAAYQPILTSSRDFASCGTRA